MNPTKIQWPSTSVKFLEIQWYEGHAKIIFSKVMDKKLPLTPPIAKRGTIPSGPLWTLEAIYSSFGCVPAVHSPSDLKSC